MEILVVGASGHGKVVASAARQAGFALRGFVDDNLDKVELLGLPVRPLDHWPGPIACALGIGHPRHRRRFRQRIIAGGYTLVTVVHPAAVIDPGAILGQGTVVLAGAVVGVDARVGDGVIVNTASSVDHDCALGDDVHVGPGARLAGEVRVGEGTWIGIGAVVTQQIAIGEWAMIGAGSVVLGDLPDNVVAWGVPCQVRRPGPFFREDA